MLEHWLRIMSDLRSMSSCRVVARCCLNVPRKRRSASRSTSRTFCNRVAFFDRSPSVAKTKRSCAFFLRNRALFKRLSAAFRPLLVAVFFSGLAVPHRAGLLSLVSRTSLYSSRCLLITDGPRRAVALRSAAPLWPGSSAATVEPRLRLETAVDSHHWDGRCPLWD